MNFRVGLLPKQGWRTHSEHGGLKKKAVSLQSIFSIDTSRGVVPRARVVEKMSLAIRPRGCVFLSPGVIVLYGKKYRDNSRYSEHAHVTQRSFLFRRFQEEKNAHTHNCGPRRFLQFVRAFSRQVFIMNIMQFGSALSTTKRGKPTPCDATSIFSF